MSEKFQPLPLHNRQRLWWYAVAGINLKRWDQASQILDALSPDAELDAQIQAARALLSWRRDRSAPAVEILSKLAEGGDVSDIAKAFLAFVHIDSGLPELAIQTALVLAGSEDETAFWFSQCLERQLSAM